MFVGMLIKEPLELVCFDLNETRTDEQSVPENSILQFSPTEINLVAVKGF